MKTVYVLVSNGWTGYYRTKEARYRDEVSQDYTKEIVVSDEEYNTMEFEEDRE